MGAKSGDFTQRRSAQSQETLLSSESGDFAEHPHGQRSLFLIVSTGRPPSRDGSGILLSRRLRAAAKDTADSATRLPNKRNLPCCLIKKKISAEAEI